MSIQVIWLDKEFAQLSESKKRVGVDRSDRGATQVGQNGQLMVDSTGIPVYFFPEFEKLQAIQIQPT